MRRTTLVQRVQVVLGVVSVAFLLAAVGAASAPTPVSGLTGGDRVTSFAGQAKFGFGGFSGDGGPAGKAQLSAPHDVTLDSAGNVYIADSRNDRIRKVSAAGIITTIAGGDSRGLRTLPGPALQAHLDTPRSVAVDGQGNVYFTNGFYVYKVSPDGTLSHFAGGPNAFGQLGDGGPATAARVLPWGVAVDGQGNVYIADSENRRVRKVNSAGIITTVAGTGQSGSGGDGGPATAAQLEIPREIEFDRRGNLYIVDQFGGRVRKVNPAGIITTVAGTGARYTDDNSGPATKAPLNNPFGVAVDQWGNVYISEDDSRIRKVDTRGMISTIVGIPRNELSKGIGDGGPGTKATLSHPVGLALDRKGNLYIADTANSAVRKVWIGTATAATGQPPKTTPPASTTVGLRTGRWAGEIDQSNLTSPFTIVLTLPAAPLATPIRAEIPSHSCVGTLRYQRTDSRGRHVFAVTWESANCGAGTIWLRPLAANAISYRWENGRGVFSVGTLRRAAATSGGGSVTPGSGTTTTVALRSFADRIGKILQQSAVGRRELGLALTAGFNCSISRRSAGERVNRVVANRQSLLRQLAGMTAPTTQAANALRLLRQGLQHSVEADIRYRDGFFALGASGCPLPPNQNFTLARQSDTRASAAKRSFLGVYNPLARRVGRRTWSASEI